MLNQQKPAQSKALLHGIKVLDLSRILAGPWATQMLADYGATVWKIEKTKTGDDTRHWGPPFIGEDEEKLSAYFMAANRGKKSLCIDITQPEGQALIKQLVLQADILVENFKVGGLSRYGLDYESLAKINPELIYCSITGFGQTGPSADEPGYDAMIQAMGGLMSITGEADVNAGQPQKVGVAVTDLMTGMYATTAILAALNYRNHSGQGQHIDLALLDTQVAMLANQGMNFLVSGEVPQRIGNSHPNIVPYQTFACVDGFIILAVGNDQQFQSACDVLGLPELAKSLKFISNQQRVNNREELVEKLSLILKTKSCEKWLQAFSVAGVPCGPVNNIQQAFEHPQIKHRKMRIDLPDNNDKSVPLIANPVQFSALDLCYKIAPPKLGQDTFSVLNDALNITEEELSNLVKTGVIQAK